MANPFDDLVPQRPPGGGLFDDLIPKLAPGQDPKALVPGHMRGSLTSGENIAHAGGQFTRGFNESIGDFIANLGRIGALFGPPPVPNVDMVADAFKNYGKDPRAVAQAAVGGQPHLAPAPGQVAVDKGHRAYDEFLDTKAPPQSKAGYIARGAGKMVGDTLPITAAIVSGGASLPAGAATSGTLPTMTARAPSALQKTGLGGDWLAKAAGYPARVVGREIGNMASTGPAMRMAGDQLLRSAAAYPGAMAGGDVVASAGAGAGGSIADLESGGQRADPTTRTIAELIGAAAAQAAPYVSPAMWVARGTKAAVDRARGTPSAADPVISRLQNSGDAIKSQAADRVMAGVKKRIDEPEIQGNIQQATDIAGQIPGFNPTLAQRTNVPSLVRAQQGLEARATGDELNAMTAINRQNEEAIARFAADSAPPGPRVDPQKPDTNAGAVLDDAVERRLAALEAKLAAAEQKPQTQIAETQAGLPTAAPGPGDKLYDPKVAGQKVRDELLGDPRTPLTPGERDKMGQDVSRLRGEIDPEGKVQIDPTTIRSKLDKNVAAAFGEEPSDPLVARMLRTPEGGDTPASLNDTLDFASKLLNTQRRLAGNTQRTADQEAQLQSVNRALDAVNAEIDRAVGATATGYKWGYPDTSMKDRLTKYRDFYKDEFVPRFQQGATAGIRAKKPTGEPMVNAEDIPGRFFAPNSLTEADQFQKVFAGNQRAQEAMTDHALASLRDSTGGKPLTQEAIDAWKAKHNRVLDRMPEVKAAVDKINVADAEKRIADLGKRRAAVARSDFAKSLGADAETKVTAALADPKLMRQMNVAARQGGPDAEAALKRMVWDGVVGKGPPDPTKIEAVLKSSERSVNIALGPKHVSDIRTIMEAAKIQGRVPAPKGSGSAPEGDSLPDKFKELTGSSIASTLQRFLSVERGRSGAAFESTVAATQAVKNLSERQTQQLLKDVLYDGRLASDLAVFIRSGQRPPKDRARGYWLSIAEDSVDDGGEKGEKK